MFSLMSICISVLLVWMSIKMYINNKDFLPTQQNRLQLLHTIHLGIINLCDQHEHKYIHIIYC